ncbi:hypothetical protein ACVA6F_05680 [Bacillus altitudinis]|uniref:hypothetical protein n=1 Tax=Bacillus TaxID=1386 RepID=UPI003D0F30B5
MNLKKVIGAMFVAGALFVSGIPVNAEPVKPGDLTPIRNKHKTGEEFKWMGYENGVGKVRIYFRDDNGDSYYDDFYCVKVIEGTCYVYK